MRLSILTVRILIDPRPAAFLSVSYRYTRSQHYHCFQYIRIIESKRQTRSSQILYMDRENQAIAGQAGEPEERNGNCVISVNIRVHVERGETGQDETISPDFI